LQVIQGQNSANPAASLYEDRLALKMYRLVSENSTAQRRDYYAMAARFFQTHADQKTSE
jgi:hypothetical protein